MLRTMSLSGTFALATYLASRAGPSMAAAHQICFQLWMASSLMADALAVAAQSLLARSLAAGQVRYGRKVVARTTGAALALGALLAMGLALVHQQLPRLFTADTQVLAAVGAIYPCIVVSQPINALAFIGDGVLFGAGGFKYAAVAMLGCSAPAAALMVVQSRAATQATIMQAAAPATTAAAVAAAREQGVAAAAAGGGVGSLQSVWAGLVFLMALRAAVIYVPYLLKLPPFKSTMFTGRAHEHQQ